VIFVVIDRTCGGVAVSPGCRLEFVLSCVVAPVFKYKCSSAVLVLEYSGARSDFVAGRYYHYAQFSQSSQIDLVCDNSTAILTTPFQ